MYERDFVQMDEYTMADTENTPQKPASSICPPSSKSGPVSGHRVRSGFQQVLDDLRLLSPEELADVHRFVLHSIAARQEEPSDQLLALLVETVGRVFKNYREGVPISLVRAAHNSTPRTLLDKALFAAERKRLLRLEKIKLPAPAADLGAAIQHERGLLYWLFPS